MFGISTIWKHKNVLITRHSSKECQNYPYQKPGRAITRVSCHSTCSCYYYTIVGMFRRLCKTLPTKQLTCSLISTCILPPTSVFIRHHERNAGMFLEWRIPLMFAGGFFSWCQCKWMSSKHRSGHLHCNLIPKECKIQRPKSIIKDHNLYQL